MQTQINCPNCRTPFPAEVFQIIDAQRQPELKQMLLSGQLNVASCPNCGNQTQLTAPLLFHDAAHELMMVYIPMELNMPMHEQDRMVSQLTKAIIDSIPQEQVKGYMIRPPQMMLSLQSFMEKVYGTEGITPEMLQRQRDQSKLMQELVMAEREQRNQRISESLELIDESFFSMVSSNLQSIEQVDNPQAQEILVKLSNLQAYLFMNTAIGRELEKMQIALTNFQQEAKTSGGLTLEVFSKHLLANLDNERVLSSLVQMGQQAIQYELFNIITAEIDNEQDEARKEKMEALREQLLAIYEQMQAQAQEMMGKAHETLNTLLAAGPNLEEAIKNNAERIDESFLYFLEANIERVQQQGDADQAFQIKQVQNAIMKEAEKQLPPEVRFLNSIITAENDAQMRQILSTVPTNERPQMGQMLDAMAERAAETEPDTAAKLRQAKSILLFA